MLVHYVMLNEVGKKEVISTIVALVRYMQACKIHSFLGSFWWGMSEDTLKMKDKLLHFSLLSTKK